MMDDESKKLADILTNVQLEIVARSMVNLFDASIASINSAVAILAPLYPQLVDWERRRAMAKYRSDWKRGK